MLTYNNGGRLIQSIDELPNLAGTKEIVLDFETTSRDDKKTSLNPWADCWALGIAITVEGAPAYYVPLEHRSSGNVSRDAAIAWLRDIINGADCIVGHNLKHDLHVLANSLGIVHDWPKQAAYCTLVQAKLLDSDRGAKGGYGLDALSRTWLAEDIGRYETEIKRWLGKSQDYATCPAHIMGEYATQDVITTRRLKKYIMGNMPDECAAVSGTERDLTSVLFQLERNGMRVKPIELMKEELALSTEYLTLDAELAELCGRTVNTSSNPQIYDLFINQFGLPIVCWTDEDDEGEPIGNASFDKEAFSIYATHQAVVGTKAERVVRIVQRSRSIQQTLSLFVQKFQDKCDSKGRLHPSFNQIVRTGRMSCKEPNLQQCSKAAKKLIHPGEGNAFLSQDMAQIEFRVIVSYLNNRKCIEAYNSDPDVDFHNWMAEAAGMSRDPAKTLNFQNGYGGGKKKCVKALSMNVDVVGNIGSRISADIVGQAREMLLQQMCKAKAEEVYDTYHYTLPELKPTSRRAAAVCYDRGYVRTAYGRHRHLPANASHRAFNTICQGTAADIQKERTVAIARAIKGTDIMLVGNVHDEIVEEGPIEVMSDPRTQRSMAYLMEHSEIKLRVPLRCSIGYSEKHWLESATGPGKGGTSRPLIYDAAAVNVDDPFDFLR